MLAKHTRKLKPYLRRHRGGTLDNMLSKISRTGVSCEDEHQQSLVFGSVATGRWRRQGVGVRSGSHCCKIRGLLAA